MLALYPSPAPSFTATTITTLSLGNPFKIHKIVGGLAISRINLWGEIAVVHSHSRNLPARQQPQYMSLPSHGTDWVLYTKAEAEKVTLGNEAFEQLSLQPVMIYGELSVIRTSIRKS